MRIINASETAVPYGFYEGMDLQEFAQEHHFAAGRLMEESRFKIEFPDQYYVLDLDLRQARRAYRSAGLRYR